MDSHSSYKITVNTVWAIKHAGEMIRRETSKRKITAASGDPSGRNVVGTGQPRGRVMVTGPVSSRKGEREVGGIGLRMLS